MPAREKVSIEPNVPASGSPPTSTPQVARKKKVVKRVVKKVVKKPRVSESVGQDESDSDSNIPLEHRNRQLLIIGIVLLILIVLTTIGLFYSRGGLEKADFASSGNIDSEKVGLGDEVDVEAASEEEIKEDKVEVLERGEITLEILNGSGVAGLAGDTRDEFLDLGYEEIEVGNSDLVESTELYISAEFDLEELEQLLDDVDRRLGVEKVTAQLSDLDTTARIILGEN